MPLLLGNSPNQVPTNGDLGDLAFQSAANIAGDVGIGGAVTATSGVITANTTTDALRITQTGSGNALVVEDSTSPDSTPFVIDTNGYVIVGTNEARVTYGQVVTPVVQINSTAAVFYGVSRWASNAASGGFSFAKSRGASVGTRGIVASGDTIGQLLFDGDDGTTFIPAASIVAAVDGTPGTNDMPGRLVFSTTADGASAPTEAMRINSAQAVSIGGAPSAGDSLRISKNITGAATSYGINQRGAIQSDVTIGASINSTFPSVVNSVFTLPGLSHFSAAQGTIGASAIVTNQYGFRAESSLIGATNNTGFYGNIPAGSGRYNFYAGGTADNYFAGNLGIGTSSPAHKLDVAGAVKSGYLGVVGTSGAFNTASRFGVDHTGTDARLYSSGADNATKGVFQFRQQGANGVIDAEAMRIDASGNVGIGTSTPGNKLSVIGDARLSLTTTGTSYPLLLENSNTTGVVAAAIAFQNNGTTKASIQAGVYGNDYMTFNVGSNTERARIDSSGNLLVGTTSYFGGILSIGTSGPDCIVTRPATNISYSAIAFQNSSASFVGYIGVSGSGTAYNTISDYRLKNTVVPMTGALDKVALLKPCTDGQGFIAHELQAVEPSCVTGEKDATETRTVETSPAIPAVLNEDGVETSLAVAAVTEEQVFPKYQGIDTSFLVATLAAAIQELKAIVDAQAVKIAALEAA
jgi:hypothetical protein